jgi:hypothetical protein
MSSQQILGETGSLVWRLAVVNPMALYDQPERGGRSVLFVVTAQQQARSSTFSTNDIDPHTHTHLVSPRSVSSDTLEPGRHPNSEYPPSSADGRCGSCLASYIARFAFSSHIGCEPHRRLFRYLAETQIDITHHAIHIGSRGPGLPPDETSRPRKPAHRPPRLGARLPATITRLSVRRQNPLVLPTNGEPRT